MTTSTLARTLSGRHHRSLFFHTSPAQPAQLAPADALGPWLGRGGRRRRRRSGCTARLKRVACSTITLESLKDKAAEKWTQLQDDIIRRAPGASSDGSQSTSTSPSDPPVWVRGRVEAAIQAVGRGLVERDTEVRLLLLAACAGEHLLLLGPPGTAKSLLARRLSTAFGGRYFERLLTRFTVPEEIFGPLSLSELQNDRYIRRIDGYLPTADVAFLDEIFKANSAILNSLLAVLNERKFDNGDQQITVPLKSMVCASNETPESDEMDALYDRFLLRRQVQQISAGGLRSLIQGADEAGAASLSAEKEKQDEDADADADADADDRSAQAGLLDDVIEAVQSRASDVEVPSPVIDCICDLRTYLQSECEPPIYLSDRRIVKAVNLLKVSAFTSGRRSVSMLDTLLLQHLVWKDPSDRDKIRLWLIDRMASESDVGQFRYLISSLFGRACRLKASSAGQADQARLKSEVTSVLDAVYEKLQAVHLQIVSNPSSSSFSGSSTSDCVWIGGEELEIVEQALLPQLEKTEEALDGLLKDAVSLDVALTGACEPHLLALLLPEYWSDFVRNGSPAS